MAKRDEVGLTEIAKIIGQSRSTAYLRIKSGDIRGAELVVGRWVVPRREVLRYQQQVAPQKSEAPST